MPAAHWMDHAAVRRDPVSREPAHDKVASVPPPRPPHDEDLGGEVEAPCYCASHKNWTSVHQLPMQNHCFIGSGGG